nr:right-handed parallel beta-helix repeat-containing protein [Chitinispirillaceae bacterium]
MKHAPLILLLVAITVSLHAGQKIEVPKDAPSITKALDRAEAGDTVFVKSGTYRESVVLRDDIALIGESVAGTIIRGNGRGPVIRGSDRSLVRNVTVENGEQGILCENVSMNIEHSCIRDNRETGIHCLVALPMIRNNVVCRNRGTGIFCETVRSHNTIIEHNVLAENGYCGIMLAGNSELVVQNNVFLGNKQFGIWVSEGARRSRITHNDFFLNRDRFNFFAQVDRSNIAVDPGYRGGSAGYFGASVAAFAGKGRDGATIGLINEEEMIRLSHDSDNDGVPDDADQCVSLPEDRDGFQDDDGCPDFDNDADGIYDAQDKCPDAAEDRDGFQDDDGCPDPDN